MKRFLPILFVLPLLLAACENVLPSEGVDLTVLTETPINTEPILYEGKVVDTDNFVSATALNAYLELQPNRLGNPKSVKSIEPTGPNADVTLMYVVNYEGGGWEIISADKRTEPILAHSSSGSFSWEKANPGEIAWMEGIGVGILNLRTAGKDAALTRSAAENAQQNINFWDGLVLTKAFIDKNGKDALKDAVPATAEELSVIHSTRTLGDGEEGHYELVSSIQSEVEYDSLVHITNDTRRWHQYSPWNGRCPEINGEPTLVGCTPLAAAQVLYYLHNAIGVPENALLGEDFYDEYPNITDSTAWNKMAKHRSDDEGIVDVTAQFLRVVGDMCDADYGVQSTPAGLDNLRYDLFAPYGVSSSNYMDYESSIVIGALKQPTPIPTLMSAYAEDPTTRSSIPANSVGHAFVVDGYKDIQIITTNVYEWVGGFPFDPTQIIMPNPRVVETVEGPIYTRFIQMAWGWNDDDDDANRGWFSPNSSWVVTCATPSESGGYNVYLFDYVYARKMITNFGILSH